MDEGNLPLVALDRYLSDDRRGLRRAGEVADVEIAPPSHLLMIAESPECTTDREKKTCDRPTFRADLLFGSKTFCVRFFRC